MAGRLERSESGVAGVRRILRRETKKASRRIRSRRGVRGEAIHDARKRLKKARAALRLVRDRLGDAEYRRENEALRDAARPLSEIRDADVLIATLEGLMGRRTGSQRRTFRKMRRRLIADRRAIRRRFQEDDSLRTMRKEVRSARQRARNWGGRTH
jgi:CHAD domain-containing protein